MSLNRRTTTAITLAAAVTLAFGSWALFIRQTPEEADEAYMTECIAYYRDKNERTGGPIVSQERHQKTCRIAYFNYRNDVCLGNRKFDTCVDQGM